MSKKEIKINTLKDFEGRPPSELYDAAFFDGVIEGMEYSINNWINAKLRLPREETYFLCFCERSFAIARYIKNVDRWFDQFNNNVNVTYWMKLPDCPADND